MMTHKFSTGCKLVIWDVNSDGLEAVTKEIKSAGGVVHPYKCNLRDRNEIYNTAKKVKEEVGGVSLLVNNAGIVTGKKLMDCADEDILATFDVNSLAHFWVGLSMQSGIFLLSLVMDVHVWREWLDYVSGHKYLVEYQNLMKSL